MSYHDAVRNGIDQALNEEPASLAVYWNVLQQMIAGEYRQGYVDVVVQKALNQRYDIYDAWVFAQIHCMSQTGDIQILSVELGHTPADDKAVTKNNAALAELPAPFQATFHGGLDDFDGEVTWNEPVITRAGRWSPGVAPLEVGTTRSATTWLHLCQRRWLARWPYGSPDVYVIQWKPEAWQASTERTLEKLLPKKFRKK
jgi:hypothetical protein